VKPQIIPITLKFVKVFLIKGERTVMIDAGIPGSLDAITAAMKQNGIEPGDVSLAIVTHSHGDHTANLAAIKKLTGARVAVHRSEAELLKKGKNAEVRGANALGSILAFIGRFVSPDNLPGVEADILIDDELSLDEFGVEGKVIHTPGHTPGSVSVALSTGDVFVGDMLMSFSDRSKPQLPVFAVDMGEVKKSISRLLSLSPARFHTSHGGAAGPEDVRKLI